ncbi:hypothetical protein EV383_4381 [Pseudonocardia sediminis]|uniref:Tail assembly chaperone n=1 Tax=Pseudonocardia sediminis TaxID=1397368 RepID=A0A4Q7UZ82_PSEST|nr:hypothetical protein [Pseudonocardia sediminis]RZT87457.1 hypothetical protein EV383_4381 [Pseudonocardia sediminis]
MKRTAVDFQDEATKDDPYEYTIKGRKTPTRPKAFRHFTFGEKQRQLKAELLWNKALDAMDVQALIDTPPMEQPTLVSLQIRFGKDFDAFWTTEGAEMADDALAALMRDIDKYYDPTPADDKDADPDSDAGKGRLTSVGS